MTQAARSDAGEQALDQLVQERVKALRRMGDGRPTKQIEAAVRLEYKQRVQEHKSRISQAR